MNQEQLESLPVGRVLCRRNKSKFRIVKPLKIKDCSKCDAKDQKVMAKFEGGGNIHTIALCIKCASEVMRDKEVLQSYFDKFECKDI